ncbi:MAG: hypothetical protein SGILL_005081 [Bacillariaceae sp.]
MHNLSILSLSYIAVVTTFASSVDAFASPQAVTLPGQQHQKHQLQQQSSSTGLFSSSSEEDYDETLNEAARPPSPPPPVMPKRLDPLMASLTRTDPSAEQLPTKNVPFLGEVPVDGSLALLIPAAGIAVIGFILSIVIAFNSSDEIVALVSQASDDITSQATNQANQQYDPNVCRGICSSQSQDLEGLRSFMDGLRK